MATIESIISQAGSLSHTHTHLSQTVIIKAHLMSFEFHYFHFAKKNTVSGECLSMSELLKQLILFAIIVHTVCEDGCRCTSRLSSNGIARSWLFCGDVINSVNQHQTNSNSSECVDNRLYLCNVANGEAVIVGKCTKSIRRHSNCNDSERTSRWILLYYFPNVFDFYNSTVF